MRNRCLKERSALRVTLLFQVGYSIIIGLTRVLLCGILGKVTSVLKTLSIYFIINP